MHCEYCGKLRASYTLSRTDDLGRSHVMSLHKDCIRKFLKSKEGREKEWTLKRSSGNPLSVRINFDGRLI